MVARMGEPDSDNRWRGMLTGDEEANPRLRLLRRAFRHLPSDPRCKLCYAPYGRPFGGVLQLMGYGPWQRNASLCGSCFRQLEKNEGGAEVELTLLFADLRGSTQLAERLDASIYRHMLNAFYAVVARAVNEPGGTVDKYLGDGVFAFFLPGFSGEAHAAVAVGAARAILGQTVSLPALPADIQPLPVGIGVHTGTAYVGFLGSGDVRDFTALGDAVNLTERLSSVAGARELLMSESTVEAAGLATAGLERRELALKGIGHPVVAWAEGAKRA
jgi:adenylate cyclase